MGYDGSMIPEYQALLEKSRERAEATRRQMKYLSKFRIKNFDHIVADFHDEAFEEIDCLKCGNCCRMLGPIIGESEIARIVKVVGLDRTEFVRDGLVRDKEGFWRCAKLPCPFLGQENACTIYGDKPRDCGDYPYTAERGMQRVLGRLAFNAEICPAAYLVAEKIMARFADGETKK